MKQYEMVHHTHVIVLGVDDFRRYDRDAAEELKRPEDEGDAGGVDVLTELQVLQQRDQQLQQHNTVHVRRVSMETCV